MYNICNSLSSYGEIIFNLVTVSHEIVLQYLTAHLVSQDGVCSTDLRLDTSTNGLKQVYTSPEAI
jgi:hypothetical protein